MSEVRVNKISPRSGTTVTLGDNGDTITIPSGVTLDASSGGLAGTLTTAAQPNITSLGTITSFTSTGIDDNATSTSITINSSGNVGIGESNPGNNLVVDGGANTTIRVQNDTPYYGDFQATTTGIQIRTVGSYPLILNTNQTERMRILHTGNVGIGTSTPTYLLQVYKATAGNIVRLGSTRTLDISNSDNGTYLGAIWDRNINSAGGIHTWSVEGNERMRIDSSGRVGIGTSSPSLASGNGIVISGGSSVARLELRNTTSGTTSSDGGFLTYFENDLFLGNRESGNSIFYTNNAERMRIDSSGNVGIGTSSPGSPLTVSGGTNTTIANFNNNVSATTSVSNALLIQSNCSGSAGVGFGLGIAFNGERNDGNTQRFGNIYWEATTNSGTSLATDFFIQHYSGTETFRVKQNGRLVRNSGALASAHGNFIGEVGSSYKALSFSQTSGGGEVGSVTTGASSTAYNTSSDYRLKENVSYDFDATTRLKQLKPARFNFIADADTTVDGFLAHEVSNVVPEAITGEKDETETKEKVVVNANGNVIAENIEQADWETGKIANEDGNTKYPTDSTWEATKVVPIYQGIDQSKLVPLLVKTIQELEARITTLENA